MSVRGLEFLERWIEENVLDQSFAEKNDEAAELADRCVDAAKAEGISVQEMEEEVGNLVLFIADTLEQKANRAEADDPRRGP